MSIFGGVTGSAADFGSDPRGLSTRDDLGLPNDGGGDSDQFPSWALDAQRELDAALAAEGRNFFERAIDSFKGLFTPRSGDAAYGNLPDWLADAIREYQAATSPRPYEELAQDPEIMSREEYERIAASVPPRVEAQLRAEGLNRSNANFHSRANQIANDIWREEYEQRGGTVDFDQSRGLSQILPAGMGRFTDGLVSNLEGGLIRGPDGIYRTPSDDNRFFGQRPDGHRDDPLVMLPTGAAVPLSAAQNLIKTIRSGGTPGPAQRAIIDAMTPAQQRAAGIFLAPDGTVRPFREVLTAAVTNAAAGRPLTTNQQAALGLAFNNIPSSGARRDAINALAGSARGEVRDNISAAVGQSMRAAADIRREAKRQTEAQTLKTAGVKRPSEAIARLAAAGITHQAADKILRLKAAGVTRPVSQVERLAAQGVRNPVQRLIVQADRRDKAAATAAGITVNKLRALRAAGVQQPAQKVAQLKAAGVRRPVQKLARLKQAGVERAAQKLVQLKTAGVKRPAQKIAALRQAGIKRGVQKVAQLKAAGVKRPAAKLARLQQAGVKRRVQQLVQLKQAGVRRPAQKLLAQAPAQRGALGKQTRQIIRTTDQSLTFKTAGGQTRTAAQVAANAAKNLAAGRPLTPNQQRLLASAR